MSNYISKKVNDRYKEMLNEDIKKTKDLIKQKQIELDALDNYLELLQDKEEKLRKIWL